MVVDCLRLFQGFRNVVELYGNFEFAPACFVNLIRGARLDVFDCFVNISMLLCACVGEAGMKEMLLRKGFGMESCSLNCTFLHQYVISVSSTPFTKTVHECV
jgi:hypothetical protein